MPVFFNSQFVRHAEITFIQNLKHRWKLGHNEQFEKHSESEITTFYLTDFLARQFEAFVIKPMGLDRHPELRDLYFGNYEKLVYQAQTDDPALTEKAKAAAKTLGLSFERRQTGYGDLETALTGLTKNKN